MTLNVQFETVQEAMAWMQRRHGLAKGTVEAAASEPDPKDKPVEPEEGEDEEDNKPTPKTPAEAPAEEPKPA